MSDLLRQYELWQCGPDGYPVAWHSETKSLDQSNRLGGDGSRLEPAIKDMIRELAGHRCQRCGHPYRKGEHGTGEWSLCDEYCTHGGPFGYMWNGELVEQHTLGNWSIAWAREYGEKNEQQPASQWRILTVHHLDEDKANCRWWNLVALCQRDHLRMQRAVVMDRPWHYEHSEWFRPYAAGFYAWKYEGADLSREETLARLDELLAYERRWTQDVLPI